MYGVELIRSKIGEDLETITAPTYSFSVGDVDTTSGEDLTLLETPALQLVEVDGSAEVLDVSGRVGVERLGFTVDLFAKDGELASDSGVERAAADVRNVLERPGSAVRTSAAARRVTVSSWEFVSGAETARSASHRVRFQLDVERNYNRGDA